MLGSAGEWVQIVGTARVPKGRLSANRRALPPPAAPPPAPAVPHPALPPAETQEPPEVNRGLRGARGAGPGQERKSLATDSAARSSSGPACAMQAAGSGSSSSSA